MWHSTGVQAESSPRLRTRLASRPHPITKLKSKEVLFEPGGQGQVWRLTVGALRLTRDEVHGPQLAGLALPGDVVGAEMLVHGCYAFRGDALMPSLLEPIKGDLIGRSVIESMVGIQKRAADLIALRQGSARERVSRLILLLAHDDCDHIVLPTLQSMADITALAMESVCREIAVLRKAGALKALLQRHHFVLCRGTLLASSRI